MFSAVMCGVMGSLVRGDCRASHVGDLLQLWQQDTCKGLEKFSSILQGCKQ